MSPLLDPNLKSKISQNFSKAAKSYNQAARLQKVVLETLVSQLGDNLGQVLDIGCGTGNLQPMFTQQQKQITSYTGLDFADGMLLEAQTQTQPQFDSVFVQADAENLPFSEQKFDHVCSSLALQWCDLPSVLEGVYQSLNTGGRMLFTTLLDGTLAELEQTWLQLDRQRHTNQFVDAESIKQDCQLMPWQQIHIKQQTIALPYPTVRALLKELKAIGANTVISGNAKRLSKQQLQALEQTYPSKSGNKMASWQVCYVELIK